MRERFALLCVSCLLMLFPVSLRAQTEFCADLEPGCTLTDTSPEALVETAHRILKVNALDWQEVINFWAEDAVYKEAVITNNSREQMCEYLTKIFAWSPNMVMQLKDEMWGYDDESGDFIYTSTNVWSGTWQGFGEYVQEGMSIVKFREGEACAYYQRDYFTEGDTWIGIPQLSSLIVTMREEYLKIVGATDRCFDADGDGWSKYLTTGCANQGKRDCNDFVAEINPAADEIPANGLDDDCDGSVDESCATFPVNPERPIQLLPFFLLYLVPAAFVFVAKKRWGRKGMK